MFQRLVRFLGRMLPALLVAAAWLAWWILPERPLRQCLLDAKGSWGQIIRPTNGEWAIIVPNDANYPAYHDFVLRFDPVQGRVEMLPTPHRTNYVIAPDRSTWAWADSDGGVHVVAPPDIRPVLTTPAIAPNSFPQFLISPEGRWLLMYDGANDHVDLWDIETGAKRGTLRDEAGEFSSWGFPSADRLRVIWLDKTQPLVRAILYQLPGGSVVETVEVPRVKGQFGVCPTNDSYLLLYGSQAGKDALWDISASPPRKLGDVRPDEIQVSPDGRYRLTEQRMRSNWQITNTTNGEIVSRAPDPGGTNFRQASFRPAFSADSRYLMMSRMQYANALPAWTPGWLVRWYHSQGYGQQTYSVLLCDPATGRELHELSGFDLVQIVPHSDRIWLIQSPWADSQWVLEEWPILPPSLPWWLWTIAAAGAIWYARGIWRRRSQLAVTAQTPA